MKNSLRSATCALALGIFELEKTDYPISREQAGELMPLWKAARSLSESETSAAAELEAVMTQIQGTMSAEQVQAITDMQLTFQDMSEIAQELGLEIGSGGGQFGNMSPEMQATVQAARESGQRPGGMPPSGMAPSGGFGGGSGPGAELDPAARETAMAERGGAPGANLGLNPALLDAVIEFLYTKTQE